MTISKDPLASELPQKFWKIRDAAIEHVLSNSGLPSGLADLQEWLTVEGWGLLLDAWINEDMALDLKGLALYKFSDYELRDYECLDVSDVISDQIRVDYARATIRYAIAQSEGHDSLSVHSFRLERDDGASAILGCTVAIHGQYGPVPKWRGVFSDKTTFYAYLRELGFLFHSEADTVGESEILALWQSEKKQKRAAKSKRRAS